MLFPEIHVLGLAPVLLVRALYSTMGSFQILKRVVI